MSSNQLDIEEAALKAKWQSIRMTRALLLGGWYTLRDRLTFRASTTIPKHDDKKLAAKYYAKRLARKAYHFKRRLPAGHPDKITGPITSF